MKLILFLQAYIRSFNVLIFTLSEVFYIYLNITLSHLWKSDMVEQIICTDSLQNMYFRIVNVTFLNEPAPAVVSGRWESNRFHLQCHSMERETAQMLKTKRHHWFIITAPRICMTVMSRRKSSWENIMPFLIWIPDSNSKAVQQFVEANFYLSSQANRRQVSMQGTKEMLVTESLILWTGAASRLWLVQSKRKESNALF